MNLKSIRAARVPLLLTAAMTAFLAGSYGYGPEARALPVLIAWTTIVLLVLEILVQAQTGVGRRVEAYLWTKDPLPEPERVPMAKALIHAFVWPGLLVGLTLAIGILPAVLVYIFLSLKVIGGKSLPRALMIAVAVTMFAWVLFEWGLSYELYRGMLLAGLLG
jgi:Na+-transporting methylmalonyl-CoA/oxaloacetate decarboxylase gamma subunit